MMEIITNPLVSREFIPVQVEQGIDQGFALEAVRSGNIIFFTPNSVRALIEIHLHECGHIIGDLLSFRKGDVLTLEEAKAATLELDPKQPNALTNEEIIFLYNALQNPKEIEINSLVISVCNKLLKIFTKGSFDPSMITIQKTSKKQLLKRQRQRGLSTAVLSGDKLELINSKKGRNDELPALTTQVACLNILENTLRQMDIPMSFKVDKTPSPAHQRAQNIVARAQKEGFMPPSTKDLL